MGTLTEIRHDPKPVKISYFQYKEVSKKCEIHKNLKLYFFLVPSNKYHTDACYATVEIDDKETICMPVNPRIARNLVHLVIGEEPGKIPSWELYELGLCGDSPNELKASSDILELLMLVDNVLGRPSSMTPEKGYYYFMWQGRKSNWPGDISYWITVKIKETIETTIELRNRGFEYDRDSLRMKT